MGPLGIAGLDVSRETSEKLEALAALTLKWTNKINLISRSTREDIQDRHIRDSAQLYLLAPTSWISWTDLGSGGGYPGLVIATLASGRQRVTLIESDARKCTFLRTAIRELDLPASVVNERIENANLVSSDVVSARALAPLESLLTYTEHLLKKDGVALFPKGRGYLDEIAAAHRNWAFEHEALPSITSPDARILRLSGINRRGS